MTDDEPLQPPTLDDDEARAEVRKEWEARQLRDLMGDTERLAEAGYMSDGGWTMQHTSQGVEQTGMTAHRGAVAPGQYAGEDVRADAELNLGATAQEVRTVYGGRRGGPLPAGLLPLRDAIDAKLARVENIKLLAWRLGLTELTAALCRGRTRGRNEVKRLEEK